MITQEISLVSVINETGVEKETAELLQQKFAPFLKQAEEWKTKANELVVTSEDQTDLMKMAREGRLVLKAIRVDADKTRKLLKEDSLKYGRAVQAVYNVIEETIKPIEEHLELQEKFKELAEAKRRDELRKEREAIADLYREFIPYGIDFGEVTQSDFDKVINGAKLQKQQAEEQAAKIEAERIENQKIKELHEKRKGEVLNNWQFFPTDWKYENLGDISEDKWQQLVNTTLLNKSEYEVEQQRIREENQRLKEEAENREKEIQAERDQIEKEQRAANIEAAKLKKEADEKAAAARAELARIEQELQDKKDAEAKIEAEKQAAIEAELSKGDKEKMFDLIKELGELPFKYQFKSKKHNTIHKAIIELVEKTTNYANSKL